MAACGPWSGVHQGDATWPPASGGASTMQRATSATAIAGSDSCPHPASRHAAACASGAQAVLQQRRSASGCSSSMAVRCSSSSTDDSCTVTALPLLAPSPSSSGGLSGGDVGLLHSTASMELPAVARAAADSRSVGGAVESPTTPDSCGPQGVGSLASVEAAAGAASTGGCNSQQQQFSHQLWSLEPLPLVAVTVVSRAAVLGCSGATPDVSSGACRYGMPAGAVPPVLLMPQATSGISGGSSIVTATLAPSCGAGWTAAQLPPQPRRVAPHQQQQQQLEGSKAHSCLLPARAGRKRSRSSRASPADVACIAQMLDPPAAAAALPPPMDTVTVAKRLRKMSDRDILLLAARAVTSKPAPPALLPPSRMQMLQQEQRQPGPVLSEQLQVAAADAPVGCGRPVVPQLLAASTASGRIAYSIVPPAAPGCGTPTAAHHSDGSGQLPAAGDSAVASVAGASVEAAFAQPFMQLDSVEFTGADGDCSWALMDLFQD